MRRVKSPELRTHRARDTKTTRRSPSHETEETEETRETGGPSGGDEETGGPSGGDEETRETGGPSGGDEERPRNAEEALLAPGVHSTDWHLILRPWNTDPSGPTAPVPGLLTANVFFIVLSPPNEGLSSSSHRLQTPPIKPLQAK
ncbi:hypothetical protein EYF80_056965 [Liparis tanakae]|uniref:Uncharacterized protein n=1 Tax=Liparis tanakae TaxID=230148 RepID=A0A4Z2EVG3_9TELE|nr:hypothetical protein EYF80_056965 [Liparis tanakae]